MGRWSEKPLEDANIACYEREEVHDGAQHET
jgi:hypothetical protein